MTAFIYANLALAAWNVAISVGNMTGAPWLRWPVRTAVKAWIGSSAAVWLLVFWLVGQWN